MTVTNDRQQDRRKEMSLSRHSSAHNQTNAKRQTVGAFNRDMRKEKNSDWCQKTMKVYMKKRQTDTGIQRK